MMLRLESANILRKMLDHDEFISSETLADKLDLTLANLNRRTAALYVQRMIGREVRYGKSRGDKLIYLHVTQHGVDSLAKYDERRLERPTVASKHPAGRVKKNVILICHPRNSIFDNL